MTVATSPTTGYPRTRFHRTAPACPAWCRSPHEEAEGDASQKSAHFSTESTIRLDNAQGVGVSIVQDGEGPLQLLLTDVENALLDLAQVQTLASFLTLVADVAGEGADPVRALRRALPA
jgi:hypothetical protein